jgi:hypothetical protein
MGGEPSQGKEGRRVQVGIKLNDQSAGKIVIFNKTWEGVLKKADLKSASGIFYVWKLPVGIERT